MANLLVDIGNTSVKIALSAGDEIKDMCRCAVEELLKKIEEIFKLYGMFHVVAISDVRGMEDEFYIEVSRYGEKVVRVGEGVKLPIRNCYSTPHTLGADRLCAAVGASVLYPGKDCVIVDFGTAITYDFITADGRFLGGNISLGLQTRFKAINHFTKKLPLLETPDNVSDIGDCTKGAIESGIVLGTIFEVEGYIKKYPHHTFVFTGGDAIFFAEKVKSAIFVVCNLVMVGLSHIAKTNAV